MKDKKPEKDQKPVEYINGRPVEYVQPKKQKTENADTKHQKTTKNLNIFEFKWL